MWTEINTCASKQGLKLHACAYDITNVDDYDDSSSLKLISRGEARLCRVRAHATQNLLVVVDDNFFTMSAPHK
jgi:hypothetical protein